MKGAVSEEILGNTEFEWNFPQSRNDRVVELFGRFSADNLLDIGCGNGVVTERIMRAIGLERADGVDILADRVTPFEGLRLVKLDIDREDLPYGDSQFEAVYCGDVIEHIYDTDHLLDEIYRILAPTGMCILSTPNLASWVNRLMLLVGFQPFSTSVSLRYERAGECRLVKTQGHRTHIRVFTLKALKELLKVHRFEVVKLLGLRVGDMGYYTGNGILGKAAESVDGIFGKLPSLAYRLAVVIRRSSTL